LTATALLFFWKKLGLGVGLRRLSLSLMFMLLALLAGCRPWGRYPTHVLDPIYKNTADVPYINWIFADLQGNEEDFLIATDNQQGTINSLYVTHPNGKVISQFAMSQKFRSITSLTDPRNGNNWLFYSFNDQRRVTIAGVKYTWEIPLKREEKGFESIARTDSLINDPSREWFGVIYPEILEDIDGDGKPELICRMLDGYRANPRGLVVYDFDSGRIKWRFDTSCNFSTVLLGDYDKDGRKEFILSSQAVMNTTAAINGFDDHSGRIAVLDINGKLLYQEKLFDGYGDIQLTCIDTGEGVCSDIYSVMSTWGSRNIRNSVTKLRWDGSRLRRVETWALGTYFDRGAQTYRFHDLDGSGAWRIFLVDKGKGLVVLDKDLKPLKHDFKDFIKNIWAVEDIDLDGHKEILIFTADNSFVVLDRHLRVRARMKSEFPVDERPFMHVVRDGFNKPRMIALSTSTQVQYYRYRVEPFYKLMSRFIMQHLWIITLLLALAALYELFYFRHNWKMFYSINRNTGLGIILTSRKGYIRRMNEVARTVLATEPGKLAERSLRKLNSHMEQMVRSFARSSDAYCELSLDIEAGTHLKTFRVMAYRLAGLNRGIMLVMFPTLNDLDADKMAWADTARRLSHHVRRHVTNVILALPRLEEEEDTEDRKEYMEIIRAEIEKIRVFTHSFQRFTELKDYELKLQDIIPSLEHVVAHTSIPESVTLIKNWKLSSVHAYIEPIRFEEALTNLINNAIEAMPEGGILHITSKIFPNHSSPKGPLTVLVELEDSGKGIPEKYKDEIWRPFFTTNQSGTGIGLPESRKIIESMGGEISIQSEEGVGTVVSVWLKGE